MAIGDLFKSKAAREREVARKRRQAFRQAERSVDAVGDRIKQLKKTRDKAWAEAIECKKIGNKAGAQRALVSFRASEQMILKLDQKKWTFEQLLIKLDLAKTDLEFAGALNAINLVVNIDPEEVASVLDDVQDKLGEQVDVDRYWDKAHEKETEGVIEAESDMIPSMEDLETQLDAEAAVEISGGRRVLGDEVSGTTPSIKQQIGAGRERLNKLISDDK